MRKPNALAASVVFAVSSTVLLAVCMPAQAGFKFKGQDIRGAERAVGTSASIKPEGVKGSVIAMQFTRPLAASAGKPVTASAVELMRSH